MLLNAFTRALRDGFPPARVAGLKAIIATGGQAHSRCWLCKGDCWTAAVHVEHALRATARLAGRHGIMGSRQLQPTCSAADLRA